MKGQPKIVLYGVLALVFLVQMACESVNLLPTERVTPKDADTPAPALPQPVKTPTSAKVVTVGDCIAPTDAYAWSYEDYRKSSGSGGVACNARFVFKNANDEPLYLIIHTAWNNNKLQGEKWETHPVQVGGAWELRVNRAIYPDGVITYSRLDRMLVVRDVPACKLLHTDQHQSTWEAMAVTIDDIACTK